MFTIRLHHLYCLYCCCRVCALLLLLLFLLFVFKFFFLFFLAFYIFFFYFVFVGCWLLVSFHRSRAKQRILFFYFALVLAALQYRYNRHSNHRTYRTQFTHTIFVRNKILLVGRSRDGTMEENERKRQRTEHKSQIRLMFIKNKRTGVFNMAFARQRRQRRRRRCQYGQTTTTTTTMTT